MGYSNRDGPRRDRIPNQAPQRLSAGSAMWLYRYAEKTSCSCSITLVLVRRLCSREPPCLVPTQAFPLSSTRCGDDDVPPPFTTTARRSIRLIFILPAFLRHQA